MTWDGKTSGGLPAVTSQAANPAANLFGSPTEIRDRSGHVVASGNFGTKVFTGTWAGDELHFCQMVPFDFLGASGVPATLQINTPGGTPRAAAQVGNVYEQGSIHAVACSVLSDRAVVVQSGSISQAIQFWVVQLSTGRILWTHSFDPAVPNITEITATRDRQYVAENRQAGATIYGPDGTQVGQLDSTVAAFSWDGTLAVVTNGLPGNDSGPVRVVRWLDGRTVWSGPSGAGYTIWLARAEPGGSRLAVFTRSPGSTPNGGGFSPVDVYVIAPDGQVVVYLKTVYQ